MESFSMRVDDQVLTGLDLSGCGWPVVFLATLSDGVLGWSVYFSICCLVSLVKRT